MCTLAMILTLFVASVAILTYTLRWTATRNTGERPRSSVCFGYILLTYAVAFVLWWLAQSRLADDDDYGAPFIVYLALWILVLPGSFLLGERRIRRTLLRWLAYGLVVLFLGVLDEAVIERYILGSARIFLVSSMSPTIRQQHSIQPCPKCGAEFVVTLFPAYATDGTVTHNEKFRKKGVCSRCLHSADDAEHLGDFRIADHFTVNRLLPPTRWKIVAFARGNPSFPKTGRLVGLPGETIFIRDGIVWVNGVRQEPPADIVPVRYTENLPPRLLAADPLLKRDTRLHGYAHPDDPLVLKTNEFFLLNDDPGDFLDSRDGGPFRGENYMGVVEVVFWPPHRWGLVR